MKLERDKQIEDPVQICVADTRRARCVVGRCGAVSPRRR